ncbi:hypothetical protein CMI42_00040 [Candidatus Pacearchaeota archaeon]|nr:hypothetical protein [Candidatus Pacearchaeota archaeon]
MTQENFPKAGKILFTLSKSRYHPAFQTWYFPLKRQCKELICFDTHWNEILYGKKIMNRKFIEFIKKEEPDYILLGSGPDELYLDTLLKIKQVSPKTKTMMSFGDDDVEFERFSRYIMLFIDIAIVHQKKFMGKYKKEGIKNIFYATGLDSGTFKPLDIEKKYDITFTGQPLTEKTGRYRFIKFLKDKGMPINLFGWGWEKYFDLKNIYRGILLNEGLLKVINQSKIYLDFSKNSAGEPHLKGRIFMGGACKTFVLTEYCKDYLDFFEEGKEIIMFKSKEDLLKKIEYYLKNEKERQKIADATYKKVIENYNLDVELRNVFNKTKNKKYICKLPNISEKSFSISEKDILNKNNLMDKLKNYDYISFKKNGASYLKFKDFLQIYSLKITKKPISCCNYYVYTKNLGDYLCSCTEKSFRSLDKEDFISFLDLSQIVVTKKFFLDNLEKFKKAFHGKIDFLNMDNTAFVDFPLVRIKKISIKKYPIMEKVFSFKFVYQLYSLYYTKKIFYKPYIPSLFFEIFSGKFFILRHLFDSIRDKSRMNKLKIYQDLS